MRQRTSGRRNMTTRIIARKGTKPAIGGTKSGALGSPFRHREEAKPAKQLGCGATVLDCFALGLQ
jgi:hypothetical protein